MSEENSPPEKPTRVKAWWSIKVQEFLDTGNIAGAIQEALNELSSSGYEPAFVTYVGAAFGSQVVVSGWRWDEIPDKVG